MKRMNKLKILVPVLLALILLLTAVYANADEAEDLTAGCTLKVVDKPGKIKSITDGKYTTYWESSQRKNPWVVISSDKPIYGLYLCFQRMPETYVIQKQSGDDWATVAEGGSPRFHHAFFELEGLKKIRILSTTEKKSTMGFNEIFAFGEGEIPDWVQRWKEFSGKADILFLATHPDDDVLFLGSAITWYAAEQKRNVQVAYLTGSNTTRRSEALNGLWRMGIRVYPEFLFDSSRDKYSNPSTADQAYKDIGGKDTVFSWLTGLFRQYRPEVVVTQDINGEYGHPQHKMIVDAAIKCWDLAADGTAYPDSAEAYGAWEVKKLYIHLYGEETESTAFNWDIPMVSMDGKTANEVAEDAFTLHVTQAGKGSKFNGKRVPFSVAEYGVKRYPNNRFGLYASRVGQDESHTDFLEHVEVITESAETDYPAEDSGANMHSAESGVPESEGDPAQDGAEPTTEAGETNTGAESAGTEEEAAEFQPAEPEERAETVGSLFPDVTAPEWADVTLNTDGFLDEGEYVFADDENGRYMFANRTLRVVIERTHEEPDSKHPFYCFTAHIWCDTAAGELPVTVFNDPEKPKSGKEFMRNIALNNKVVFATTTDYYIYRIKQSYPTGIEVRNGEVIFDDPHKLEYKWGSMPTYETLALYRDGHADSLPNRDKDAKTYIEEGATQVYTFGPCLVKNSELTEYARTLCNNSYNPRLAIGVAEDGHYIVMLCEGRLKRSKGVQMAYLAELMLKQGCTLAVNMDGGQSAVIAFMGHQLNQVVSSDPNGRSQADILAFGTSDQVGTFEMADEFKSKRK